MAAGEKSSESFASLYLKGKTARGGRARKPMQADLFGGAEMVEPTLSKGAKDGAPGELDSVGTHVSEARHGALQLLDTVESAPLETVETHVSEAPAPAAVSVGRRVWTVRELVGEIRGQVERAHFSVWVEGEISNCRPAPSGHLYFTLKDGEAQLPVVLFRRQAQLLSAKPKDGDAVEVRGRVSVYESRGQLQLIAETLELRGAGALEAAFKRLKARLLAEGLFAEERKRPLPAFPRCIGVVTSMHGAVVRDIVNVVRRRHVCLNVLVYPAAMQGVACAATVTAGIRWFNRNPERVDLIVLARGGGSIEDLAGFNDEGLARAIAGSALPVVSAIGHETDFTIADFVADLRAPTPSAAAELVTAAQHRIEERVYSLAQRVERAGRYQVMLARQRYLRLSAESVLGRLRDAVGRREQRLDELRFRLEAAARRRLRLAGSRVESGERRLVRQDPSQRLALARVRLGRATEAMERVKAAVIARRRVRLERVVGRLEALSPLAVLSRGYALVYGEGGELLRDASGLRVGSGVRARLAQGSLRAMVEEIEEAEATAGPSTA